MHKYECDLWQFLKKKTRKNYDLRQRLNLAVNICEEVNILHRVELKN